MTKKTLNDISDILVDIEMQLPKINFLVGELGEEFFYAHDPTTEEGRVGIIYAFNHYIPCIDLLHDVIKKLGEKVADASRISANAQKNV